LEERYKADRTIHAGEYLYLLMIGVADGYKGCKIAQNLIKLCLENGIKRGYQTAVTQVTGPISQHILRDKFGFTKQFEIVYKEFTYQSERPFESIEDPPSIILMDKALDQ
jgi:ribosomal protein S18 acetylase RimI-like enzyme